MECRRNGNLHNKELFGLAWPGKLCKEGVLLSFTIVMYQVDNLNNQLEVLLSTGPIRGHKCRGKHI